MTQRTRRFLVGRSTPTNSKRRAASLPNRLLNPSHPEKGGLPEDEYLNQFTPIDLPLDEGHSGFIYCGEHPRYSEKYGDGKILIMIGPDMEIIENDTADDLFDDTTERTNEITRYRLDWNEIGGIFPRTFAESSGSGGGHIYYIINKHMVNELQLTTKYKNVSVPLNDLHIEEIDIRYNHGLSFCAGSDFSETERDHYKPYTIEWDEEIKVLSDDEFKDLFEFLIEKKTHKSTHTKRIKELIESPPEIPIDVRSDITMLLANQPYFQDSGHTRHDEIRSLALIFREYKIPLSDSQCILDEVQSLTATEDDKPAHQIAEEMYRGEYGTLKAKLLLKGILDIKPADKRKKTPWDVLKELLSSVSSRWQKLKAKAERKARRVKQNVMEEKNTYALVDENVSPLLLWCQDDNIKRKGEWRKLNEETGVRETITTTTVKGMIHTILENNGIEPRSWIHRCYERLQELRETNIEFNKKKYKLLKEKMVINSKDFVVENFDENNENHYFSQMSPRTLKSPHDIPQEHIELIEKLLKIVVRQPEEENIPFPFGNESDYQKEKLKQALTNIMWSYVQEKLAYVFIGPYNSAKSVFVDILERIFPHTSGAFDIKEIGKKGGLAGVYDKDLALQNELNGGYFPKESVEKFKDIFSDVKKIDIRILYKNPFDANIRLNMVIASNQLLYMPEAFESESTYKRFFMFFCPNIFPRNEELVKSFQNEGFLDSFLSYFLHNSPEPLVDDLNENIRRSRRYYKWSSSPIDRIIRSEYQRDYESLYGIAANEVYRTVQEILEIQHSPIPTKLPKRIKDAVERLGGSFRRNKKTPTGRYNEDGKEIWTKEDTFIGINYNNQRDTSFSVDDELMEVSEE